jgi:hypothetical protein
MWLQTRNRQNQIVFSHFHVEHFHKQQLRAEVYFPIEKTDSAAELLFSKLNLSHVMI